MRYLDILGVLEDGSDRSPDVPSDVRVLLVMPSQQPTTLRIRVVRPNGLPVDLSGSHVVLTVKRTTLDTARVYTAREVTLTSPHERNYCELLVNIDRRWPSGHYVWDLWLHGLSSRDILVPTSPLRLEPTAGGLTPTPA